MHMHNGVGRTGYLLLALFLFLVGGLGVAVTVLAFETGVTLFVQIGVALAAVGLTGLFGFAASAPWLDRPMAKRKPLPVPERDAELGPEPRPAKSPAAASTKAPAEFQQRPGPTFEFDDARPAARAAPTEMVMPAAFRDRPEKATPASERADPAAWPQERGKPSSWSVQRQHDAKVRQEVEDSPVRREMQERYTRNTPTIRGMLQQDEAPLKIAERAPEDVGPGFAAPGMSVGRCGRCKTALMAPDERPLRLKCPECAKVTLLE